MRIAIVTALVALALPSTALAADVPAGATWTQATIPSSDGVKLHADVLRPTGATGRTPVILSIGPYFNHAGQTGPAGPVATGGCTRRRSRPSRSAMARSPCPSSPRRARTRSPAIPGRS